MRRACLTLVLFACLALSARGQTPDTLTVPQDTVIVSPDTTIAPADTVVAQPAPPEPPPPPFPVDSVVTFYRDLRGTLVDGRPPERRPALNTTELLEHVPGTFAYSFRTGGWPDAWSIGGRDPATTVLLRDGRPFNSLTTGRPLMEMLPIGLIDPARLAPGLEGGSATIVSNMQTFDDARPITGIRFLTDGIGLQRAEIYHAQRRVVSMLGTRGLLNLALAYRGGGSTGEYPGSVLRRERGLFARARFATPRWSLAISNLSSRHNVGAHAGVVPQPAEFYQTIFVRPGAVVRRPDARRQTIRNEFDVTWRAHLLGDPFTLQGYWTAESFRYYESRFDLPVRVHRYGARVEQPLVAGRAPVRFHGWIEGVENDSAFVSVPARHALEASVGDSLSAGFLGFDGHASLRRTHRSTSPGGSARISVGAPAMHAYVRVEHAPVDLPRLVESGFGPLLAPADVDGGSASDVRLGGALQLGVLRIEGFTFSARDHGIPLLSTGPGRDTLVVHGGLTVDRVGVGGFLGFRERRARGIYASVTPSFVRWVSPPSPDGLAPLESSAPAVHIDGRLGARMLLFQGDLDADLYVRGRYWSDMRGRIFHPATGLLVMPAADDRPFAGSGLVDVVLEAGVRTATLFLSLENILSGTEITVGNLIVPDYPLPEQRLRFGVFWPILD